MSTAVEQMGAAAADGVLVGSRLYSACVHHVLKGPYGCLQPSECKAA